MTECHDHQLCIKEALRAAQAICVQNGARLTKLRQQILLLLWQSHKPLGAYALMEMLAKESNRKFSPPTVYRTLDFLLGLKLIHRIHSLNAYIGCSNPHSHQQGLQGASYFFICSKCHETQEIIDTLLTKKIAAAGESLNFSTEQQWLEVTGLCQKCQ